MCEREGQETSEDDETNVGEWIKSKHRKKAKIKTPPSLTNTDSDEHPSDKNLFFNRSIKHFFKEINHNNLQNSTTYDHQNVKNNIQINTKEFHNFHPFIIQFQSKPTLTQLEIIQQMTIEWEKINNLLKNIKITGRQGHDGFLIFAMNQESFNKLMIGQWPNKIANISINIKQPRLLPPEHSIIIYRVFKDWDINEINIKLKEQYSSFRKATRIIAKTGTPTQMIRADFNTSDTVQQLLKEGYLSIGNSIHQIRLYFAPARVPMCYKCHRHDHPTVQCTNNRTCFRCNTVHDFEKNCTRPIQCANCLQNHYSGHASCPQVQQIRKNLKEQQNLNRNKLLIQQAFDMKSENFPSLPSTERNTLHSYSTITKNNIDLNLKQTISRVKHDTIPTKNESKNINESVEQIILAHTQHLENILDKKFDTIMQHIIKIDQNHKQSENKNKKVISIIKNKIIPAMTTITSVLASKISDYTMKNILHTVIETLSDENNDIINQAINKSTFNNSCTVKECN